MFSQVFDKVCDLSKAPTQKEAFDEWLKLEDAFSFLEVNLEEDEFVVYACATSVFIQAVLVPRSNVRPPDYDDLLNWSFDTGSCWAIWTCMSDVPSSSLSAPLENSGTKSFHGGEQLVFLRSFQGRIGEKHYFEALQKFTQAFGLHFLPERNAYCRLDGRGDIEDVIRIMRVEGKGGKSGTTVITFKRKLLDQYNALTEAVIVRTFDFTRTPSHFRGWSGAIEQVIRNEDLMFRMCVDQRHASYARGVQIIEPLISKEMVAKEFADGDSGERRYASFIAVDWKNKALAEISCEPGKTANYFTKSELPFELSPAFFRPEVLLKYKADSDKYCLQHRSISCRGAWELRTYDINDAGQVHTYIVYLRDLPYEEQLHWKNHNEEPLAPISKRSFTTDFEGKWDEEYDPLLSLKSRLRNWNHNQVAWWVLRDERSPDRAHYPVTSSADEWADEILHLDQLLVEGFDEKWMKSKAKELGRVLEPQFRSIRVLAECLIGLGFEVDHARQITAPLQKLHSLRSKLKGHASGDDALEIKRNAFAEHGSYKQHFRALCTDCDQAIETIDRAFNSKN